MKKLWLLVLVAALLAGVLALPASSESKADYAGDVVTHTAKAYADPGLKRYIGKIPAGTALLVRSIGDNLTMYVDQSVAKVIYMGVPCYIRTSNLMQDRYDEVAMVSLPRGIRLYQRPDRSSASRKLKSGKKVICCGVKNGWALVRTNDYDFCGFYAYVPIP